ncbi:MAG: CDP-alcohol phosphatidyltransferase family protein [Deltaproteobacteria bacterium]|nr:CDP-alcohol phosphatidyltransferase family protein [Deltaproteobacteria bacterium]
MAALLGRAGATPNAISAFSVVFAFVAAGCLAWPVGWASWLGAALAIQGRLLCNLFDGMVAVEGGKQSATGELWNDLPDRVSDTVILVGAGVGAGQTDLGALAAIAALHVAYLRVLGRAAGARSHFAGPMAKQHRMALLTGACLLATWLGRPVLTGALVVLVVGCAVTVGRRWMLVSADLHGAR